MARLSRTIVDLPPELVASLEAEASRRGTSRNEVVRDLIAAGLGLDALRATLDEWRRVRNECTDEEVHSVDAKYADRVGLPTLAALARLLDWVERTHPDVAKEAQHALSIARGEAQERVRRLNPRLVVPGDPAALERPVL